MHREWRAKTKVAVLSNGRRHVRVRYVHFAHAITFLNSARPTRDRWTLSSVAPHSGQAFNIDSATVRLYVYSRMPRRSIASLRQPGITAQCLSAETGSG